MPGEEHLALRLGRYVLSGELFQQLIAHLVAHRIGIQSGLVEIVTIPTGQIASRSGRLQHHKKRMREWRTNSLCVHGKWMRKEEPSDDSE